MTGVWVFVAICGVLFGLNQRGQALQARKELRQYAARMESAELDLHAIRSVATNLLWDSGTKLKAMIEKPDRYFLEELAENLDEVQEIVEKRGPATIAGQPYWHIRPQENNYKYGDQYPMFPD